MLITKPKNSSFLLISILGFMALGASYLIGHYIANNREVTSLIGPDQFISHLDLLTTDTWSQIETGTGITQNDCKDFLRDNADYFKEGAYQYRESIADYQETISDETLALIHEVCLDFSIDPKTIDIICYHGNISPASADDYTLYINDKFLRTLSVEAQRFVIAHELSHFKNKDNSYENTLACLTDPENREHTVCRRAYTYLIEWRADITALLNGSKYSQGGIAFFNELIDRHGDKASSTHPRSGERLKMAKDIHAMHMQQEAINLTHATNMCPEQFLKEVDSRITSTWQQLETNAGVTMKDCEVYLAKYGPEIKAEITRENTLQIQELGPVSTEITALIQEILHDFNIPKNEIDIVAIKTKKSPAGANAYSLYIDEQNLKTFCPEAQRFIIAHEISHIKNKDSAIETALINLLDTENKDHSQCIATFTHSIEFRADTHAMLKNAQYAQGGIAFLKEYINRYGDKHVDTHPRPSERLKMAEDIYAMHSQQNAIADIKV